MPQNDFTRKIKDFDNFSKIAQECSRFGQINCDLRLWKVAQSPNNHQSGHTEGDEQKSKKLILLWMCGKKLTK